MSANINKDFKEGNPRSKSIFFDKKTCLIDKECREAKISVEKVSILSNTEVTEIALEKENNRNDFFAKLRNKKLKQFADTVLRGFLKEFSTLDESVTTNCESKTLLVRYNCTVPMKYESTISLSNAIQLNTLLAKLFLPLLNVIRRQNLKESLFDCFKIIFLAHIIIKEVNTSRLYHLIKLQSYMKIFALINFLQLIEKLTSTILVDLTGVKRKSVLNFALQLPVLLINSLVITMQALTFNVIINSKNSKQLNILLITISFNKLKSTTFKKFNSSSLFQTILQDSNDRFQLNLSLMIVCLKNYYYIGKITKLLAVTMITDWMHQLFIVRYNDIDINLFSTFKEVMIDDYEKKNVIYRLGMPVDGRIITCIVLLYRRKISVKMWCLFIFLIALAKIALIFGLEKLSEKYLEIKETGSSQNKQRKTSKIDESVTRFIKGSFQEKNAVSSKRSISEIVLYEMNGKKIF
ncbi:hypothetical protein QEN19_001734 [Hanseniaspora menglaensis]